MKANRGIRPTGIGAFENLYDRPEGGEPPELVDLTYRPDWGHIKGFLQSAQELGFDPYDGDILRRAIAAGERAHAAEPVLPAARWGTRARHDPLVYFIQLGPLIKIGTTTNIVVRMESLNPERVLALTAGGRDVESGYHRRFAATRRHGEWFDRSPELDELIVVLREQFEADSGMTVDTWLGRH